MEDGQGDAAEGSNNGGVSVLPLSEKLLTEPFVENMSRENEADEAYEEEIMVEIVGSDVFVNGISGEKEDCLVSEQVENLEGYAWDNREKIEGPNFSEAMYGNQKGEIEIGFLGSKGECNFVDMEGLNVEYVAISEEMAVKNEAVDKYTTPQDEDVVVGQIGKAEKEGVLSSNDNAANVTSNEAADLSDGARGNATEGEVLVTCGHNDGVFYAKGETVSIGGDCGIEVIVVEEKVLDAECKDSILGFDDASHCKIDDLLDFENGDSYVNLSDLSCLGNDKYLKNGGDMETDMVHQNHIVSNKPVGVADGCQVAEMSEDNGDIQADTEENQPNTEHIDPEMLMKSLKSPINAQIPSINVSTGKINISKKDTCVRDVTVSCVEVNNANEDGENSSKANGFYTAEDERESDGKYSGEYMEVDFTEAELETGQTISETTDFKLSNEETMKPSRMKRSRYLWREGDFVPSSLVWGKVRSHPWWPGQIFDPSHASEKAVKYYKKDSYLVAYFGDGTFAWNRKFNLKPFGSYFIHMDKQSKSETFQNAVYCALEEVSRRVELGLACSCIPKDEFDKIEAQIVDNAGIRKESGRRYVVDHSTRACCFEPNKFLEYVTDLGTSALSGPDRLGIVIAQAQLSAFYRFKGYRCLTEFASYGDLLENDEDSKKTSAKMVDSKRTEKNPKTDSRPRKKRSSMELVSDKKSVPLSSGRKRKASFDPQADVSNKKVNLNAAKVCQNPKPSFRIGDCIRRAASRLTVPTSSVKGNNNDEMVIDGSYEHSDNENVFVLEKSISVDEMLDQLEMVAQNPKEGDGFQINICTFLTDFRKKDEPKNGGIGEEFEFDSLNESYWGEEKPVESGRKSNSRKRFSGLTALMELDENVKKSEQESSPAELILNFADRKCVRSETNLNKMFRRFGPLMESETEVDRDSGRAKVVFKRSCDAEVALNSAEKFSIFGPVAVGYEIGYSPLISVKTLPTAVRELQEDETLNI